MTEEAMRKAFECDITEDGRWPKAVERLADGTYRLMQTHAAWRNYQLGWQAATRAAAPAWRDIESAPTSEDVSFLVLRRGIVIQVSWFEGRLYPDARESCIDWEDGITDATHWMPLPAAPEKKP